MEKQVKILPVLCRFQLGIQVKESLKILCTENVPLKFLDHFDTYRIATRLLKKPELAEYARTLIVKMDKLELKRDEIEAAELKKEQEKQQDKKDVVDLTPESPPDSVVKNDQVADPTSEVPAIQKVTLSPDAVKKLSLGLRMTPDSLKETEAPQQAPTKNRKGKPKKVEKVPVQEMASATLAEPVATPDPSNDGFKAPNVPGPGRRGFNRRMLVTGRGENSRSTSNSVSRPRNEEKRGRGKGNRRGRGGTRQSRARVVETITLESDSSDAEMKFTSDQIFDKYELLYRTETLIKFPELANSKPEGETWTAYFKRLHRAQIEKQQDRDVVCLSGPASSNSEVHEQKPEAPKGFVVATDVEPNSSNEPSTSGRIPTFRVNPNYLANRHKYM
ncbi:hypothetical protein CAEBREN_08164 [Caenorhabditis brenneri]|uniref:Uncharacterized protein n=1 Tax=Caenorhabditis brenneri TaxID=135651 RepID=G0MYF6_CAEBE|nr:hypothetical protein CAEBREN_08164 [Caenorhabditis brenneri]